jgi:hypothetical protein
MFPIWIVLKIFSGQIFHPPFLFLENSASGDNKDWIVQGRRKNKKGVKLKWERRKKREGGESESEMRKKSVARGREGRARGEGGGSTNLNIIFVRIIYFVPEIILEHAWSTSALNLKKN